MYPTRIVPMAVPMAAGISTFGNWAVLVLSVLGLLLVVLLAVRASWRRGRASWRRGRASWRRGRATHNDRITSP
jgi:hypothetical protein